MERKHFRACSKGPMGEFLVCIDLMDRGYEVFRACGNFESFDLVAHKDGRLLRIQVKAGQSWELKVDAQDVVAIADLGAQTVEYDPPLERFEPAKPKKLVADSLGIYSKPIEWETAEDAMRILKEAGR